MRVYSLSGIVAPCRDRSSSIRYQDNVTCRAVPQLSPHKLRANIGMNDLSDWVVEVVFREQGIYHNEPLSYGRWLNGRCRRAKTEHVLAVSCKG